jgi:hypothetical protein
MTREFIPVAEVFAEWRRDPERVAAYDALETEFALAERRIASDAKDRRRKRVTGSALRHA